MPIDAQLAQSLQQHFEKYKQNGQMTDFDGSLAETLHLIFHGNIQQSQQSWQQFARVWSSFSHTYARELTWPLFVYQCWTLAEPVAYIAGQGRIQQGVAMLVHELRKLLFFRLISTISNDERLPKTVRDRLLKVSDWLKTQPLASISNSIMAYSVVITGSYPRYVFEYLIFKARQALGDNTIQLELMIENYERHLLNADIDVLFHLLPKPEMQNQMCSAYTSLVTQWPTLIGKHWDNEKIDVHQSALTPGAESVMFDDKVNKVQITVHAEQLRTLPKGNLYLNFYFNPVDYEINQLSFPSWPYGLDQLHVIHTFFSRQIMTPALWGLMQQGLQFGLIESNRLSLLAHLFKTMEKALNEGWILSPQDRYAVTLILTGNWAVRMANGQMQNLAYTLSQYIASKYFPQQFLHEGLWLQRFLAALTRSEQLRFSKHKITMTRPKVKPIVINKEQVPNPPSLEQEQIQQVLEQIETDKETPIIITDEVLDLNPGTETNTLNTADQELINKVAITSIEETSDNTDSDSEESAKSQLVVPNIKKRKKTKTIQQSEQEVVLETVPPAAVSVTVPETMPEWLPENETTLQWYTRKVGAYGYMPKTTAAVSSASLLLFCAGFSLTPVMTTLTLASVCSTTAAYAVRNAATISRNYYLEHLKKSLLGFTRISKEFSRAANCKETFADKTEKLAQMKSYLEDILIYANYVSYFSGALAEDNQNYFIIRWIKKTINYHGITTMHHWVQRDFAQSFAQGCYFIRRLAATYFDRLSNMNEKEIHAQLSLLINPERNIEIALLCIDAGFNYSMELLEQDDELEAQNKFECFIYIDKKYKISSHDVETSFINVKNKEMLLQVQKAHQHFAGHENLRMSYYKKLCGLTGNVYSISAASSWILSKCNNTEQDFTFALRDFIDNIKPLLASDVELSFSKLNSSNKNVKKIFKSFKSLMEIGVRLSARSNPMSMKSWEQLFIVPAECFVKYQVVFEGLRSFIEDLAKIKDVHLRDTYFEYFDIDDFYKTFQIPIFTFLIRHADYFTVICELKNFAKFMHATQSFLLSQDHKDYLYQCAEKLLLVLAQGFSLPKDDLTIALEEPGPGCQYPPSFSFSIILKLAHQYHQMPGDIHAKKSALREKINQCQYDKSGLALSQDHKQSLILN
jgi:hypothetical protein